MGDSSSIWNDNENGYVGDDDSTLEDESRSNHENAPHKEEYLGDHDFLNDLEPACSENTSEVCLFLLLASNEWMRAMK
jgi:hypothetical protein